jgi:hypothetical protein
VLDTDKAVPALVQVAQGIPVNEGKPVTEINVAGAELIPVKLKVKVGVVFPTLLLIVTDWPTIW